MNSEDSNDSTGFVVVVAAVATGIGQLFGAGAPSGPLHGLGGVLQAQARAATGSYLSQALFQREAQALHAFEEETPGGVGQVIVNQPIDPRARELASAVVKLEGLIKTTRNAKKAKLLGQKLAKKERKLAKRELAISPQADVRVSQLYGPNAGYWREYGAPPPLFLTQRSH